MAAATILGVLAFALGAHFAWVRIAFRVPQERAAAQARFVASNDQGNFGELLTAVILTQLGWRQLPSKLAAGGHGIDGLFVRRRFGFQQIMITETKTNSGRYKSAQLETGKLARTLSQLYEEGWLDWQTSACIIKALKRRSPFVRKQCWRHMLDGGKTLVRRANRDGELSGPTQQQDNAHLMESLTTMLAAIDRDGHYIHVK